MANVTNAEVADILFSLNKKAKNARDKQKSIVYLKQQKITKSNKGEITNTLNTLKKQKYSYYEEKDKLLDTYFQPICIHKSKHVTKTFEYIHNMKDCVDIDLLMKNNFKSCFAFNFLQEKYQKKVKVINYNGDKFNTNLYLFNNIIKDQNLIETICNEIARTFPEISIKGNKIYIPFFRKETFYKKLDYIFVKHLWNGKHLEKKSYFKKILELGNIRIAKKEIITNSEDKYYLFYKIEGYSFHRPIIKEEISKYPNLKIQNVTFDTKGEIEEKLMKDTEILQKLKEIQKGNLK